VFRLTPLALNSSTQLTPSQPLAGKQWLQLKMNLQRCQAQLNE
jgi:hypothetical protein